MGWKGILLNFVIGGPVTALIVWFEESDHPLLSGLATLIPIFTLVSYVILGETRGGSVVGQHSWFVLAGTLISWVPYMVLVAVMAPRIGTNKAIGVGLACFFVPLSQPRVTAKSWK